MFAKLCDKSAPAAEPYFEAYEKRFQELTEVSHYGRDHQVHEPLILRWAFTKPAPPRMSCSRPSFVRPRRSNDFKKPFP